MVSWIVWFLFGFLSGVKSEGLEGTTARVPGSESGDYQWSAFQAGSAEKSTVVRPGLGIWVMLDLRIGFGSC